MTARRVALTTKLPGLLVAAVILTAAVSSVVAVWVGHRVLREQALAENVDGAEAYATMIGFYLERARAVLEATAPMEEIVDFGSERFIDHGVNGLPSGVDVRKRTMMALIVEHAKIFEHVMLITRDGRVYLIEPYEAQLRLSAPDLGFMQWHRQLLEREATVVSDLHISPVTQRPTVTVAVPVRDRRGRISGALAGALKLAELSKPALSRGDRVAHGYGYVTDRRGLIIAHQKQSQYVQYQTDYSSIPPVKEALEGGRGSIEFFNPIAGEGRLSAYLPLPEIGWAVVYVVPTPVALAPVTELTRTIVFASFSLVLVVTLVGVFLARRFVRPLRALAVGARAVAAGELETRIEVTSGDELEELAEEFNRMAGTLSEKTAALKEAERKAVEARFAALLDVAPDAIISLNDEQRIVWFNRGAERIFGYPAVEVVGRPIDILLPARVAAAHRGHVEAFAHETAKTRGMAERQEISGRRKDGTEFPAEASISKMEYEGRMMFNVILRDITERVKLKAELLVTNEELERRNRALEEASNHKSEFLAHMSHEIRTPMNGVLGMTGLLLDTPLTIEQREYAEATRSSAEALLAIINDILDLSKIEAGKMRLEAQPFELREVVEEAVDLLTAEAVRKGLQMTLSCAPGVPEWVAGDAGRIRQIVWNLAGNAVKFTEAGQVQVEVTCEEVTEGRGRLRFTVADTGPGIPEEKLAGIFERFIQGDMSVARKHGGAGLGLAIAKELAELMKGTIGVESRVGEGSVFWFTVTLPVVASAQSQTGAQPDVARLSGPGERSACVLVAEDNIVNQRVAARYLEKLGCRVDVAENGREALDMEQQLPYDLIFMDCQMPELDGYEATRAIRQHEPNGRHVPIVALTAYGMAGDREKCLAAGMDDYVPKPVDADALQAVLRRWLGWPERVGAAPRPSERHMPESLILQPAAIAGLIRSFTLSGELPLMRELVELYLRDAPERIAAMRQAALSGDAEALEVAAHTLKSSSATLGVRAVEEICRELEGLGRSGTAAGALPMIDQLEIAFSRAREALLAEVR